jgi:hypothetical protein
MNVWIEDGGRRYIVTVDSTRTVLAASVECKAHDKRATLRVLRHPVTLARLQALVRPAAKCPHCGREA